MNLSEKSQKLIEKATKKHPNLKLSVGIYHKGETTLKLFDKTGEIPYESHFYEIGSITKVFTTSLLAKFLAEGAMSLEDSIGKYFPTLEAGLVLPTIEELATHTSGYNDNDDVAWREALPLMFEVLFKGDGTRAMELLTMDREEMLRRLSQAKLKNRGKKWAYSNFGMALLGQALAEVAGISYRELMQNYVLELGLRQTFIGTDVEGMMPGYNMKGKPAPNFDWKNNLYAPAGALTSNVEDIVAFGKLHLMGTPDYLNLTHEVTTFQKDMGLGWWLDKKHPSRFYHGGNTPGYSSQLTIDKEKDAVVVLLSNVYVYKEREALVESILAGL